MPRKIMYRRQLLQAIEAFLEGTPSSLLRAHHIIQRCNAAISGEDQKLTINQTIWGDFIKALTDSVFYESEEFLQETREILRGHSSQNIARTVFTDDYRLHFTVDEAEWYAQLRNLLEFIAAVPFAKIHEATIQVWQSRDTWATARKAIPEAIQAEEIEAEYQQRKASIKVIASKSPMPQNIGDEKIYHLVLREITSLLAGICVGKAAVYCGYPILDSPYTWYGNVSASAPGVSWYAPDMSESVKWAKRMLEALEEQRELFISWHLTKAPTFDSDVLLITLH